MFGRPTVTPEQTVTVQQDIGRYALNMATTLKALLDMMAHNPDARDLLALRSFAVQGWELSRDLAELLASFEGDATDLTRDLLDVQTDT